MKQRDPSLNARRFMRTSRISKKERGQARLPDHELLTIESWSRSGEAFKVGSPSKFECLSGQEGGLAPAGWLTV